MFYTSDADKLCLSQKNYVFLNQKTEFIGR